MDVTCKYYVPSDELAAHNGLDAGEEHRYDGFVAYDLCWNRAMGASRTQPTRCQFGPSMPSCDEYVAEPARMLARHESDHGDGLAEGIPRYVQVSLIRRRMEFGTMTYWVRRIELDAEHVQMRKLDSEAFIGKDAEVTATAYYHTQLEGIDYEATAPEGADVPSYFKAVLSHG